MTYANNVNIKLSHASVEPNHAHPTTTLQENVIRAPVMPKVCRFSSTHVVVPGALVDALHRQTNAILLGRDQLRPNLCAHTAVYRKWFVKVAPGTGTVGM